MSAVKHQPATPLPWSEVTTMGGRYVTAQQEGDALDRSKVVYRIADAHRRRIDAAYIAHTANAYPKLVAALRRALERKPMLAQTYHDCRALLGEIGEAS